MVIGGFDAALAAWPWALVHWPDVVNGIFTAAVARFQVKTALETIRQEEIVGPAGRMMRLYFVWSLFTAWLFFHLDQPFSAVMYGSLAASQSFFLLACWIYGGTFNLDRRADRVRWRLIRTLRHIQEPLPADLFEPSCTLDMLVAARAKSRADLPESFCSVCQGDTQHDLDGHCIACDTKAEHWGRAV